jgi:hypothetical protein
MKQITLKHLAFVEEAKRIFEDSPRRETHWNKEQDLIALRFGEDRDCVVVYELGEFVGNFVQQVDKRIPAVRKEVDWFAREMELQLQANDHKGGWHDSRLNWLLEQVQRHVQKIKNGEDVQKETVHIANYAMMMADNVRRSILAGGE